ncbi:MraY family glycosyltransferase [Aestuariirhabdus haliotis]|uniref:MraY family glycosyltransferase n=1 Tax=Aestuariirhabdus haliotis TaxID=2918751 RepID=UPI0020C1789F|nr:glycosyltransferase family 4 protein [Aestuariirhabdus haliotis]MCL6419731.1 glycosyltransferase family 4 protein [Aestuariirhabdus haliotis]
MAIVICFLLSLLFLFFAGFVDQSFFIAFAGGGAGIALLGFLDDHGHIPARWRLVGHFLASAWLLFWIGGLPTIYAFGVTLSLGWIGNFIGVVFLVWLLNLYNFMDGIDGIAAIEAIFVCLGGGLLYLVVGELSYIWPLLLLAASVFGFLYWNFPPARIFMGDAGSGFLGFVLAGLALQAAWVDSVLLWGWLILLAVFIVDATFTLLRRLLRGDKVYEAHRSHAYQYASRKYRSHRSVSLAVLTINVLWLLPLAVTVAIGYIDGALGFTISCLPLIGLAFLNKAGELETPGRF